MIKECLVKPKQIIIGVGNKPFDREKHTLLSGREILICLDCGTVDEILKDGKYRRLSKSNYAIVDNMTIPHTSKDEPLTDFTKSIPTTSSIKNTTVDDVVVTDNNSLVSNIKKSEEVAVEENTKEESEEVAVEDTKEESEEVGAEEVIETEAKDETVEENTKEESEEAIIEESARMQHNNKNKYNKQQFGKYKHK